MCAWQTVFVLLVAALSFTAFSTITLARKPSTITAAELSVEGGKTAVKLRLTTGVTAEVFTLADPFRMIVDLPDVAFELPDSSGQQGKGLVLAYRYGLFAERKARMVFDTSGPVAVISAAMKAADGGEGIDFEIVLEQIAAKDFGHGTGADRKPDIAASPQPALAIEKPEKQSAKPVVLIDPGHGGIDPGAIGVSNVAEKTITLKVAQQLKAILVAGGKYDVRMTREKDIFISLDQRLEMSEAAGTDLFVSLHADSIAETAMAKSIRGATVYTLSERASDEQARRMAEKENASDAVAGLESVQTASKDDVRNILIDLLRRETANFSADFSNVLVKSLSKVTTMSRDPQRSAAFKVLKQSHSPSVLVELGYLSNQQDEEQLGTPEWQKKMSQAIARAIDSFFSKRVSGGP